MLQFFQRGQYQFHFVIADRAEQYVLPSLEYVDIFGYLYRYLKNAGYDYVVALRAEGVNPKLRLSAWDEASLAFYRQENQPAAPSGRPVKVPAGKTLFQKRGSRVPKETEKAAPEPEKAPPRPWPDGRIVESSRVLDTRSLVCGELEHRICPFLRSRQASTAVLVDVVQWCKAMEVPKVDGGPTPDIDVSVNRMLAELNLSDPDDPNRHAILFIAPSMDEFRAAAVDNLYNSQLHLEEVFSQFFLEGWKRDRRENNSEENRNIYLGNREKLRNLGTRLLISGPVMPQEVQRLLTRFDLEGRLELDYSTAEEVAGNIVKLAAERDSEEARKWRGEKRALSQMLFSPLTISGLKILLADPGRDFYRRMDAFVKGADRHAARARLEAMVGMKPVADEVASICDQIRYETERMRRRSAGRAGKEKDDRVLERIGATLCPSADGSETPPEMRLHLLIYGMPGTGKSTVARMYGEVLKEEGILPSGHTKEVSLASLKGQYIGESIDKINKAIDEAIGGVLFLDEAQQFVVSEGRGSSESYEKDVMNVLLKAMEDRRGEFAVVFAGYEEGIKTLLAQNEGMASRFRAQPIRLEEYDAEQLTAIFRGWLAGEELEPSEEFSAMLPDFIRSWRAERRGEYDGSNPEKQWANVRTLLNEVFLPMKTACGRQTVMSGQCVPANLKKYYHPYVEMKPGNMGYYLDGIVGLEAAKEALISIIESIPARREHPELFEGVGHYLFFGPPGTGKTTFGRLLGRAMREANLLKVGAFREMTGADFSSDGQTTAVQKVKKELNAMLDSILLIDDFGAMARLPDDALKEFITFIENHRDRICVILSGYEEEFENLAARESGFGSRIKTAIHFAPYQPEDLLRICKKMIQGRESETGLRFVLEPQTEAALLAVFDHVQSDEKRMRDFGNGRGARNLVQDMTQCAVVNGRICPGGSYALTVNDLPRKYRSFAGGVSRETGGMAQLANPAAPEPSAQRPSSGKPFFGEKDDTKF